MATIKIEQLRKTYGGIVAVDGMDLEVAAGSIHAVVGENGAGKSTLMKVLAGAVRPGQRHDHAWTARSSSSPRRGPPVPTASASCTRSSASCPSARCSPTSSSTTSRRGSDWCRARRMEQLAQPVLERLGLDVDTDLPVGRVTIGERQLVELAAGAARAVPGADPRRAELGVERSRDAPAVRHPPRSRRRGHHDPVRVAPPRGGVRDRRSGDGDARRARGADPGDARPGHARGRRGDGRHEAGPALPDAPRRGRLRQHRPGLVVDGLVGRRRAAST